jgi:hypothetical protein
MMAEKTKGTLQRRWKYGMSNFLLFQKICFLPVPESKNLGGMEKSMQFKATPSITMKGRHSADMTANVNLQTS